MTQPESIDLFPDDEPGILAAGALADAGLLKRQSTGQTITVQSLRQIDQLIAQHLFDWSDFWEGEGFVMGYPPDETGFEGERAEVWQYSEDLNAAWAIVDEFDDTFTSIVIETYSEGWLCRISQDHDRIFQGQSRMAPIAICLAALKTKGIEVELAFAPNE